jgi:ribosomal-protein-alanine N-acetyltransferase
MCDDIVLKLVEYDNSKTQISGSRTTFRHETVQPMPLKMKMSELETERLRLREFRQSDLPVVAGWDETLHAEEFLEFCFRSYREWGMGPWAMVLKETPLKQAGVIVGNCGFCRIRYEQAAETFEHSGEVNYYVARQYRGQGLATEALRTVLKFGFGELRLTRIQGRCAPENVSSERVLLKAGLKYEMMLAPTDSLPEQRLYAITREDFRALRAS